MKSILKRIRNWIEGVLLLGAGIIVYSIVGSHFWPSEFNVEMWLKLNGVCQPKVQIFGSNGDGVSIHFQWCEELSPYVLAWIPNIVSIDGWCDIDVASLKNSPHLAYLDVGPGWVRNQEMLIDFQELLTVSGCVEFPFEHPVLIERNRRLWRLDLRATESNIATVCEGSVSEDYNLMIDDDILKRLSRKERNQLRNSRYLCINNRRRDVFFKELGEDFFNGGKE